MYHCFPLAVFFALERRRIFTNFSERNPLRLAYGGYRIGFFR